MPASLRSALIFPEPLARELHYLLRCFYPKREGELAREMEPRIALPPLRVEIAHPNLPPWLMLGIKCGRLRLSQACFTLPPKLVPRTCLYNPLVQAVSEVQIIVFLVMS